MKALILSVVVIYSLICLAMFVVQRKLLYFPTPASNINTNFTVTVNDELTLKGWQLNPGKVKALIYYGGNAESIEYNVKEFSQLLPEYTLYFVPYRGYSGNPGKPSEKSLYQDALAVFDHVKDKHQGISLLGRSLGSGVATYVGANRNIDKLILVTPYDSISRVAEERFKWLPVKWLLSDTYESWRRAGQLTMPILVIAAENDGVIPRKHTNNLLAYLSEVTSVIIAKASHNNVSSKPEYRQVISGFLAD